MTGRLTLDAERRVLRELDWDYSRGTAARRGAARAVTTTRQVLELILRNYRRRLGELDLVLREGDTLVIAEVRTRCRDDYGGAAASVDAFKQRRIVRAAQQLLQQRHDLARMPARFDVGRRTRSRWRFTASGMDQTRI